MRRKDREVIDHEEIRGILARSQVCTLSLAIGDEPYGVMLNYGYEMTDEGKLTLYFHSATEGRKIDMLRKNPTAAFSTYGDMEVWGEDGKPCSYTALYESLMGRGKVSFIEESGQKRAALDILMHNHGMAGEGHYEDAMLRRVAVLRLDVDSYTAKCNRG